MAKRLNQRLNQRIAITVLVLGLVLGFGPLDAQARDLEPQGMEGQVLTGKLDEKARAERAMPRRVDAAAPIGFEMRLEPLAEASTLEKSEPIKGFGSRVKIGEHREMPAAFRTEMGARDLVWEPARGGGEVAAFSVSSPGAEALRVALDFRRLPRGAEVRFYAPGETAAAGGSFEADFLTTQRKSLGDGEAFWSPVVHGETAVVEIWVPSWRRGADVRVSVREISHIHESLAAKDLSDIGSSGSCNKDIACFKKWLTAGDAVAKIVYESGGGTFLCTGQLMANPKEKFLFLTAAHCISTRNEGNSMIAFWRFQRASCGGGDPTTVIQTGGGAKLLFTSRSGSAGLVTDHTLLQLRRDPTDELGPVSLLGWWVGDDPEDNLRKKIHAAHHPSGDVKRGSRGKVQDLWQLQPDGSLATANPPTHYQVGWNRGTTEGGSSGSPILIGKRWPKQYVIGVLTGGLASCSAKKEPDFYGLFEETFRRYKKFRKRFQ